MNSYWSRRNKERIFVEFYSAMQPESYDSIQSFLIYTYLTIRITVYKFLCKCTDEKDFNNLHLLVHFISTSEIRFM